MKKVTLLVPDEMVYIKGTGHASIKSTVPITSDNLIKALTYDDYHMNYYFEGEKDIRVVSIENCDN